MVTGRDDSGSAVVEFLWLTLLMLVPLVYVVVSVLEVQRAAYASSAAARGAVRAYLSAPDQASAGARARAAVRLAFADQGVGGSFDLVISCAPDPVRCLAPGEVVRARVRAQVVLPLVPAVLGAQAPSVRVSAESAAPYGSYRDARP